MKSILCTLFNVNYLDKGLALYNSLEHVSKDFILYVLAMDDKCYEILTDLEKPFLTPIRLTDFENKDLIRVKPSRSFGEYCWTCASSLIKYVFITFYQECCTYIDADMYFYADPAIIIKEMYDRGASVLITGHRFKWYEKDKRENISGRYCVEFNTFKNDDKGNYLLNYWIQQCIDICTHEIGVYCGDQKYLDNWLEDYDFVVETNNFGAGVAPWNICQYKMITNKTDDNSYILKREGKNFDLIFYHFENVTYIEKKVVNINIYSYWGVDSKLVHSLYINYLLHIDKIKDFLIDKYDLNILILRHPGWGKNQTESISRMRYLLERLSSLEGIKYILFKKIPEFIYSKKNIINLSTIKNNYNVRK
jgi:hypothetical protein